MSRGNDGVVTFEEHAGMEDLLWVHVQYWDAVWGITKQINIAIYCTTKCKI